VVHGNAVKPEIIHQNVTIVGRHCGAVSVRSSLAVRVGAVTRVLKAGNCLAERSVGRYAERGGAPSVIVCNKGGGTRGVDGDFAWSRAPRRNSVEALQLPEFSLYGEGSDRAALFPVVLTHFIHRIKVAPVWG